MNLESIQVHIMPSTSTLEQGPKSSGAFTFGPQDWGMSGNPIEPGSTSADAGVLLLEKHHHLLKPPLSHDAWKKLDGG
ncbi:hypothetical protein Y1Q_0011706 [Alligator mississippiensis]|uniref:Uncharacterized protein n=1 Tax=Alligator mississippiensis TaxID=8496 RepID=A0A151M0T0_ALLMI|nr:hypothetical protein Y1Q_0011706 [Alligator mississippiensis]